MKTTLKIAYAILLFIAVLGINAKAQITLEHTYNEGNGGILSWGEVGYHIYDTDNQVWTHYNASHQLVRTITIPSIPGYTTSQPSYYGTTIFNTDNDFEYHVIYFSATGGTDRIIRVYKENGTQLFTRTCDLCFSYLGAVNDQPKMLVYNASFSEVYSLGGEWPFITSEGNEMELELKSLAYPNPSSTQVTIEIPQSESGDLTIHNNMGQQVGMFTVKAGTSITFPVAHLISGTYMVNLNGQHLEKLVVK